MMAKQLDPTNVEEMRNRFLLEIEKEQEIVDKAILASSFPRVKFLTDAIFRHLREKVSSV